MSDAVMKDQREVTTAAAEPQPVEETTPAVAAADESDKKTEGVADTENGEDKKSDSILKTTAQANHKDYKKNRKYDPTTQPVTDDPSKIRAQVEFYFGDSNLPIDKFMWEQTGGEENKPMPLKTICNFKRMRQFQPYSAVVAALRESEFLDVLGDEGEETVKRKVGYVSVPEAQKARLERSIYAKGFGDEEPSTQFDVEAFFSKHGHVNHVKLRRTHEELFKGSVFVEFSSVEEADAFVKLDPKPTWKGHELLIMKKKDYLEEKTRQIREGEKEPNQHRRVTFFEGKERGGARGGARGRGRGGKFGGDWKDKDQKNGHKGGRSRGRGRGGRGFRGGRGGGRDNKGRDEKKSVEAKQSTNDVQMPTIQSTAPHGKRAREDDGGEAPAAKKVDTKAETATAQ
ncbi:hypothetical protein N657DRAFT_567968 [Parathielavia appendiculata]|uniref:Uncharacterized protein n=1 Tax=Parathielavia appendiculata TaxID=2587402 RepID=A0AAN6U5H6_9PEZI|nr:hypothetical protein N657DRAFT_567968 [Parathielavia appendiculata]